MNAKIMWVVFATGCVVQWAAPLLQVHTYEKVKAEGAALSFRCRAPDPFDMLRGRFLAVRADPDSFESAADMDYSDGEQIYALLETAPDGLAVIKNLTRERPSSGAFMKVTCEYSYGKTTHIRWPFDRFYVNEKIAPKADEWYRRNIGGTKSVTAEVRVLDGRAVLVDLKLDGRSFQEILAGLPDVPRGH